MFFDCSLGSSTPFLAFAFADAVLVVVFKSISGGLDKVPSFLDIAPIQAREHWLDVSGAARN